MAAAPSQYQPTAEPSKGRADAEAIFRAAVASVDPLPKIAAAVTIAKIGQGRRLTARTEYETAAFDIPPDNGSLKAASILLDLSRTLGTANATWRSSLFLAEDRPFCARPPLVSVSKTKYVRLPSS